MILSTIRIYHCLIKVKIMGLHYSDIHNRIQNKKKTLSLCSFPYCQRPNFIPIKNQGHKLRKNYWSMYYKSVYIPTRIYNRYAIFWSPTAQCSAVSGTPTWHSCLLVCCTTPTNQVHFLKGLRTLLAVIDFSGISRKRRPRDQVPWLIWNQGNCVPSICSLSCTVIRVEARRHVAPPQCYTSGNWLAELI
jgi:hypothetical protein